VIGNVLEIEPCFLRFDNIIGEGQFGDVYKATYTTPVCTVTLTYLLLFFT